MASCVRACGFLLALVIPAFGQAALPEKEDSLGPPTKRGVRLTPGMARAMGQIVAQNVFVGHYGLDAARKNEAAEAIARRVMNAAHQVDAHGAALAEYMITQVCQSEIRRNDGGGGFELTPEMGKDIAEEILPSMPAIRELLGGVASDLGPMLPLKQRLKMAGELTVADSAIKAFEMTMERWARGEARPGENPFDTRPPQTDAVQRDTSGQSAALKAAREGAEKELDKLDWIRRIWENYLKEFKEFYALDESQKSAADSLLREYIERARVLMQDTLWRDQIYRSRLWITMAHQLRMNQTYTHILNSRYQEAMAPINAIGDEFRLRLEEIPTEAQRTVAEARIQEALKKQGYDSTEAN